jgi:hypothetical protein
MPILASVAPLQEQLPSESVSLRLPPQLYTGGVQDLVARLPCRALAMHAVGWRRRAGERPRDAPAPGAGATPLFLYAPDSAYTAERMIAARLTTIREISGNSHPRMNLTRF